MFLNLFRDLQDAYKFFNKEVKKEFEGIKRVFPTATNFQETIGKTEATITWDYSTLTLIKENHIWNPKKILQIMFNHHKYCHHICHAVVEDSVLK